MSEPGRTSLLVTLGVFAALVLAVNVASRLAPRPAPRGVGSSSTTAPSPSPSSSVAPEVAAYLGPLAEGAAFEGFRVTRVDPLREGRLTVQVGAWSIDLHARDDHAPKPLAETAAVALYLRGSGATSADALAACTALGKALSLREAAGAKAPPLAPLPH